MKKKPVTQATIPIEFYVPRNELDPTKEILYNLLTCHVRMQKQKLLEN